MKLTRTEDRILWAWVQKPGTAYGRERSHLEYLQLYGYSSVTTDYTIRKISILKERSNRMYPIFLLVSHLRKNQEKYHETR